jgi:hypothetical protein
MKVLMPSERSLISGSAARIILRVRLSTLKPRALSDGLAYGMMVLTKDMASSCTSTVLNTTSALPPGCEKVRISM